MNTDAATIRIPPAAPPSPVCPGCGGVYEQSVKLESGQILRGHVPRGPYCSAKSPVLDRRERRQAFAKR